MYVNIKTIYPCWKKKHSHNLFINLKEGRSQPPAGTNCYGPMSMSVKDDFAVHNSVKYPFLCIALCEYQFVAGFTVR